METSTESESNSMHMDVVRDEDATSTSKQDALGGEDEKNSKSSSASSSTGDDSTKLMMTESSDPPPPSSSSGNELGMSDEELARLLAKQFEEEEVRALQDDESFARQLQEMEERERQRQRADQRRQQQHFQQLQQHQQQQQQQQHQQQQHQQQQQQLQQYLQSAQRHVAAATAAAASASSSTSTTTPSPPASGWEAPALPSHFLFGLTSSSTPPPPPPPMSPSSASSSSSAPSPSTLVAPPPAPAPPLASLHAGMRTSYSVLRKSRRTEEGEEEGKNETAPTTEQKSDDQQPATTFTCPICDEADITEDELYTHTTEKHADVGQVRMICPICAVRPNGNPNYKSRDYLGHLGLRHKPARLRSSSETAAMEAAAAPPQLRQSRPRTHLITRTARGFQMISNRSLDTLFDYLIHVDSDLAQLPPCQLCHRKMKPTHTRAILACGHHFHAQCLPSGSPSPVCPLCERKAAYFAAKASAASSSSSATPDLHQPQTPEQSESDASSSTSSLKREEGEEAEAEAAGLRQGRSEGREGADENEMTCED